LKKILLVEDASNLAQVIVREFKKEGFEVFHASDGDEALKFHENHHPDVIILDWMLPKIDGLEVMRRIRQNTPTPVLMLTARDEVIDRIIGLEAGADDYLIKPFNMRELISRVRALLRRSEINLQIMQSDRDKPHEIITHGSLLLDPEAHDATLAGDPIGLSRTEFNLLYLLLSNPGRSFSRDYLLDVIWGETYYSGDRSVDNVVLRLRKKLGLLGEAIETVWGVGYRWRRN